MKNTNTFEKIYRAVQLIPKGKVTTYGEIANFLGLLDARVVGWALNKNPNQITIPCHRVVNRFGSVSKAFAFGGENEQVIMLKNEGVKFITKNRVDLKTVRFTY